MRHITCGAVLVFTVLAGIVQAQEGLVAHYTFNEGSGTVVNDSSGNGNHGTISGASWVFRNGSYALRFDGEDDFVNCGQGASLNLQGPVTLAAWVRPDSVPTNEVGIAGKGISSYLLTYYTNQRAYWYCGYLPTENYSYVSGENPPVAWSYLVGTFDGEKLQLYRNGSFLAERTTAVGPPQQGGDFLIGRGVSVPGYFKGLVGEVKVYSRALSGTEVLSQYEASAGHFTENGLLAYYPLDEGAGSAAYDATSNDNDGAISGGAQWDSYNGIPALCFDGADDFVNCGAPELLDISGPVTVSAWVYADEAPNGEPGIAGKSFTSYLLSAYLNHRSYWYISGPANCSWTTGMPTKSWVHIVGTFNQGDATRKGNLRVYLDGELMGDTQTSTETPNHDSASFYIGCHKRLQAGDYFKGRIADVKVYNRALSADEARAQYNAGAAGRFRPSDPALSQIPTADRVVHIVDPANSLNADIGNKGGVQVNVNGAFFILDSTFSYPATAIGTNAFSQETYGCESAWGQSLTVTKLADNKATITAQGASYRVQRTVQLINGKVEVEDAVSNVGGSAVGTLIEHAVRTQANFGQKRISRSPEDPVLFVTQPEYDLGLLVVDPITRARFKDAAAGNRCQVFLDNFGVPSGQSHTLKFVLYPMAATGDSMNFVNAVRNDLGANSTVYGPACFFDANNPVLDSPAEFEKVLNRRNLRVLLLRPWLDYDPGMADHVLTRDEYKTMLQAARNKIKAVDPTIKVLGCIELDWVMITRSQIGDTNYDALLAFTYNKGRMVELDATSNGYLASHPWVTDNAAVRTAGGNLVVERFGSDQNPLMALRVYPAPDAGGPEGKNKQWRFLEEQAEFICETVGLDGFNTDEFTPYATYSYGTGIWDGTSVDINRSTGQISSSYLNVCLVGGEPRTALIQYAANNGYLMTCNGYATTSEETALSANRFAETWTEVYPEDLPSSGKPPFIPDVAVGQFGTPIGLGARAPGDNPAGATSELLMRVVRLYLRHGMLYYYYMFSDSVSDIQNDTIDAGPIKYMFPITPVRLFEGGIIGQERILTCVSGTYDWDHAEAPGVLVFGLNGVIKKGNFQVTAKTGGGWLVQLQITDWSDVAVILPWPSRTPTLKVQSTPVEGAAITGTSPGTTNYAVKLNQGSNVTLTAPASFTDGSREYGFVRWILRKDPGLAARFPLNEGGGNVAYDASGNGNDGGISGATWVQEGGVAKLSFDGADDEVFCGSAPSLDITGPMTLSAWAYPTRAGISDDGIAGKFWAQYLLSFHFNSYCYWYIAGGGNGINCNLPLNSWSHLVGTFDGSHMKLYVNGVERNSKTLTSPTLPSGEDFWIGRRRDAGAGGGYFAGKISDVKLYSRALVLEEVEAQYALGPGGQLSAAQPDGQRDVSFTMDGNVTAEAEYAVRRTLSVQSTPVEGAAITGTAEGTTSYTARLNEGTGVTLTAPETFTSGSVEYGFVRWVLRKDSGLAARFPLNEGADNVAHDTTGNGNDGTISGATWVQENGIAKLSFDGADDEVNCGNGPSLNITGPMTLSAWAWPASLGTADDGIAGKHWAQYLLSFHSNRCCWYIAAGDNGITYDLPLDSWSHLVGTFDGSEMKLYVNGVQRSARNLTSPTLPGGETFWIGRRRDAGANGGYFAGKISDVKLYSRALASEEVAAQYALGPGGQLSAAQPDGDLDVSFTMDGNVTAEAEYAVRRTLSVQSIPVEGAAITGTAEGTTDYTARLNEGTSVTLTAPETFTSESTEYGFVRWVVYKDLGLAARFPLNEGADNVAHDTTGNGNDGTISGATWVQENNAAKLSFDGADDEVNCGSGPSLDITGPMTLSAWAYPTRAGTADDGIAGKHWAQYLLSFHFNSYCYWYIAGGGNGINYNLPLNSWSHLVGTFDGSDMKLYVNGVQRSSATLTAPTLPSGETFWIGRRRDAGAGGGYFAGKISDVKLYSRALASEEVAAQYALGPGGQVGVAQPDGQRDVSFIMEGNVTAEAEYSSELLEFIVTESTTTTTTVAPTTTTSSTTTTLPPTTITTTTTTITTTSTTVSSTSTTAAATTTTLPRAAGVIVDNADKTAQKKFEVLKGKWSSAASLPKYGSNYRYTGGAAGTETARARWSCTNLPAGQYQVRVFWQQQTNRSSAVPYVIKNGTTQLATVIRDQKAAAGTVSDPSAWNLLGTYTFEAGKHVVEISNAATGSRWSVGADAVEFVKVGQ